VLQGFRALEAALADAARAPLVALEQKLRKAPLPPA
jgi:hypothetical protein